MLYIDSVAGMKLSLNFFSNPNVKTQLTENSVLGLKEKKLQLCIFYFIFFLSLLPKRSTKTHVGEEL